MSTYPFRFHIGISVLHSLLVQATFLTESIKLQKEARLPSTCPSGLTSACNSLMYCGGRHIKMARSIWELIFFLVLCIPYEPISWFSTTLRRDGFPCSWQRIKRCCWVSMLWSRVVASFDSPAIAFLPRFS